MVSVASINFSQVVVASSNDNEKLVRVLSWLQGPVAELAECEGVTVAVAVLVGGANIFGGSGTCYTPVR